MSRRAFIIIPSPLSCSTVLGWKAFAHEENCQLNEAEEEVYKVSSAGLHSTVSLIRFQIKMKNLGIGQYIHTHKLWTFCFVIYIIIIYNYIFSVSCIESLALGLLQMWLLTIVTAIDDRIYQEMRVYFTVIIFITFF